MRVDLDAQVRTSDGHDAGTVDRAVIDPKTNEVTHFVLDSGGLFGRKVLVPTTDIERASRDGDAIRLELSKAELEALPEYVDANYSAPPAGWTPPAAYAYPLSGFAWPGTFAGAGMYPALEPMGAAGTVAPTARPGDYAAANTSASPSAETSVERDPPQLSKGAMVHDSDGDHIGVVDDVQFDATSGRLTGFVLRAGGVLRTFFGGGDTVFVDARDVDRIDSELVHLKTTKDALSSQPVR